MSLWGAVQILVCVLGGGSPLLLSTYIITMYARVLYCSLWEYSIADVLLQSFINYWDSIIRKQCVCVYVYVCVYVCVCVCVNNFIVCSEFCTYMVCE